MNGDDDDAPKRLIVISAGNVPAEIEYARISSEDDYPAEDPSQAWNAITVGGYTDLNQIADMGYEDWSCLAGAGELSPYSRTSVIGLMPVRRSSRKWSWRPVIARSARPAERFSA